MTSPPSNYTESDFVCQNSKEDIDQMINEVNVNLLIVQAIAVGIIGAIGMVLNVLLISIIILYKKFHIRTFILALQILIIDNIYLVFVQLPVVVTAASREWLFDEYCLIGIAYYSIANWRWLVMFLLTLDRLLTVFYPFRYRAYANKLMATLSILTFLFILLLSLFPFIGIGCYAFHSEALTCIVQIEYCELETVAFTFFCHLYVTLNYIIIIVPVIMYIAMCVRARQLDRNVLLQIGTFEGEEPITDYSGNHQARNTVLILFVGLIVLTTALGVSITLSMFSFTLPYQIAIYFCNDIHFAFPIADAVIISRNKDIKDTIMEMFKRSSQ